MNEFLIFVLSLAVLYIVIFIFEFTSYLIKKLRKIFRKKTEKINNRLEGAIKLKYFIDEDSIIEKILKPLLNLYPNNRKALIRFINQKYIIEKTDGLALNITYKNKPIYIINDKKAVNLNDETINQITKLIGEEFKYYLKEEYIKALKKINSKIRKIQREIEELDKTININLKNTSYNKKEIENLTGLDFEEYIVKKIKGLNYYAYKTTSSGDYGVDIIAYINNKKICIQCKKWKENVGVKAVQEIYFGKSFYDCDEGWLLITSGLTENAKTAAKKLGIKVLTPYTLIQTLKNPEILRQNELLKKKKNKLKEEKRKLKLLKEKITTKIKELGLEFWGLCPWCNGVLELKHGKYGYFLGCENYPSCTYTKNIKM